MRSYEIPIFSRPIQSPDFMAYISKPRRRRFHDKEIWPSRYSEYLDKLTRERYKAVKNIYLPNLSPS